MGGEGVHLGESRFGRFRHGGIWNDDAAVVLEN